MIKADAFDKACSVAREDRHATDTFTKHAAFPLKIGFPAVDRFRREPKRIVHAIGCRDEERVDSRGTDQSAVKNRRFEHRVCGECGGELAGPAFFGDGTSQVLAWGRRLSWGALQLGKLIGRQLVA